MEQVIDYTVLIWKEGSQFVARTMPLDVVGSGASPEGARQALDETMSLFLKTAKEMGTLEAVLEEFGYECRDGLWMSPDWLSVEKRSARVMS